MSNIKNKNKAKSVKFIKKYGKEYKVILLPFNKRYKFILVHLKNKSLILNITQHNKIIAHRLLQESNLQELLESLISCDKKILTVIESEVDDISSTLDSLKLKFTTNKQKNFRFLLLQEVHLYTINFDKLWESFLKIITQDLYRNFLDGQKIAEIIINKQKALLKKQDELIKNAFVS